MIREQIPGVESHRLSERLLTRRFLSRQGSGEGALETVDIHIEALARQADRRPGCYDQRRGPPGVALRFKYASQLRECHPQLISGVPWFKIRPQRLDDLLTVEGPFLQQQMLQQSLWSRPVPGLRSDCMAIEDQLERTKAAHHNPGLRRERSGLQETGDAQPDRRIIPVRDQDLG